MFTVHEADLFPVLDVDLFPLSPEYDIENHFHMEYTAIASNICCESMAASVAEQQKPPIKPPVAEKKRKPASKTNASHAPMQRRGERNPMHRSDAAKETKSVVLFWVIEAVLVMCGGWIFALILYALKKKGWLHKTTK